MPTARLARSGSGDGECGMVLAMTLWILGALSLLLLAVAQAVGLSSETANAFKNEASGEALARGAVFAVAQELAKLHDLSEAQGDEKKSMENRLKAGYELDFYLVEPDSWKVVKRGKEEPLPSYGEWQRRDYAVCHVFAEDAKAPLSKLKAKDIHRIQSIREETAAKIEKFVQQSGNSLRCMEQLLALKDAQGDTYSGGLSGPRLDRIFTFFTNGKLYINRASPQAIAATLGIDIDIASGIAETVREGHFFMDVSEVEKAAGLSANSLADRVILSSEVYRIKAWAIVHGHARELEAVVSIGQGKNFNLLYMGGS